MKKITAVWALLLSVAGMAQEYGSAATSDPVTRIPALVKPVMDVWMRDTWVTLGPDGYYYLTGTTAARDREFAGAPHCWDWNDGIRLWRSKDLKHWEEMGMVWSLDGDAAWQQEPRVYKEGEKYPGRSVNGDVLDNRFRAVWAPELHYIKSQKNWFLVACMNNTSQGGGSFVLRSTTGRPEGPYENIEGNSRAPPVPED